MDCILYIDLFFLWNFWINALVLFLVRQIIKTYRTLLCLVSAGLGAFSACIGVVLFLGYDSVLSLIFLEFVTVLSMNLLAFGCKNLLWHMLIFCVTGTVVAGILYLSSIIPVSKEIFFAVVSSIAAVVICFLLEKKSRIRWKEEHMKVKTVLEFGDRRLFATALMDTGNKLYDPIFHKPVILVDEKMIEEILRVCKTECPERLHFIPFQSVGREKGLLEGLSFDHVSIKWQNKHMVFHNVIAASTKETSSETTL